MASADVHSRARLAGYRPELLSGATALIAGVGALGQNLALDLALSGVGEIDIVDFDTFEPHNATRSPLYPTPDEQRAWGLEKAPAVAHKLKSLMTASQPRVRYATSPLQALGNLPACRATLVFSAVDNAPARGFLAEQCHLAGKALFEGGFRGEVFNLTVFGPEATDSCYRCYDPTGLNSYSCRAYALKAEAEHLIPAIQNTAAVLGALQAEAGIQWIHGHREQKGRRIYGNLRLATMREAVIVSHPRCPGIHRAIPDGCLSLACGQNDSLATLLREVRGIVGDASIRLPSLLCVRIACTQCRRIAEPRAPDWRWHMSPSCEACGGPFPLASSTVIDSLEWLKTEVHIEDEVGDIPCAQAGFAAGTTIEVWPNAPHPQYGGYFHARLRGTIEDLLTDV